ncbi:hypothetical protein SCOCK_410054 [Actinacidiphila cocklensis]|uniref:Uncharacterized protein n=1 Tax=Actinacidiphila cocklensis TaxID=887465 RepID=A0A9W4DRQ8_9ACTN|nr:hypothetical protein SCOCK_410054 [Actinacidiphila cocklensis]
MGQRTAHKRPLADPSRPDMRALSSDLSWERSHASLIVRPPPTSRTYPCFADPSPRSSRHSP